MSIIDSLNRSRKELLDLGLRNPLINHRKRAKQIRIIDEYSSETYRILVNENKKMRFLALKEDDKRLDSLEAEEEGQTQLTLMDLENEIDDNGELAKRHIDNKLQSSLDNQGLQKKLLTIHRDAKTYIEEKGVNILFLALGFLYWYESESSDEPRRAPLILVPVDLSRSDVKEKFQLIYSNAEISDNLSLREKLRLEFNISLPTIDDTDEPDVNEYFKKVSESIKRMDRWKIESNEITLGFFSFGKFLMYKDLDAEKWPSENDPRENEILNALLTDGFENLPKIYEDDVNIDELVAPTDLHLVMDADSSQMLALMEINKGRNLVIQGPPGTGKSQTITNIIADAIGQGKTVLFVSEKMAALEVVKRRLDHVHMGDCALELHSFKTNKKAVLSEIEKTLNLGKPREAVKKEEIRLLTKYISKLNEYAIAVNKPIGETAINFVTAIGKAQQIKIDIASPHRFEFTNMENWSLKNFRDNRLLVEKLDNQLGIIGNPTFHPYHGSRLTNFLPDEKFEIIDLVDQCINLQKSLSTDCLLISEQLGVKVSENINDAHLLINTANSINDAPEDLQKFNLFSKEWKKGALSFFEAQKYLYELNHKYENDWDCAQFLNSNLIDIEDKINRYKGKWWRIISVDFHRTIKELFSYYKHKKRLKDKDQIDNIIKDFIIGQQYLKELVTLEQHSLNLFQSEIKLQNIDWTSFHNSALWFIDKLKAIERREILKILPDYLSGEKGEKIPSAKISDLKESLKTYTSGLDKVIERINLNTEDNIYGVKLKEMEFSKQFEKFANWKSHIDTISDWVSYNHIKSEMTNEGLTFVVDETVDWPHKFGVLLSSFDYSWYYGVAEKAYKEYPEITVFNKSDHELTKRNFINLDKELLVYNQYRLASNHFEKIPQLGNGGGQLRIIQNELHKKRRHMPIRKLVEKTGQVLQVIKPVFMMSPMSIATYIPPGTMDFDLIVFDEASQVKPVDAFGAILRAKQCIVVGDNKQLPPTSFFDSLSDDAADDDYEYIGDLESILSFFLAKGANEKMLKWHYRSKHDSLIAVSNNEFYDNKLFIFPSSGINKDAQGLVFHHLTNTSYDRGKTRTNPLEADAVAKAVIKHIEETPDLSLGVVAFSVAQRDAIIFHLENYRRKNTALEYFFTETSEDGETIKEPFFVKNLENVQGDERDVIFISVGYGKTKEGYFPMSFGPLNRDGGERRLNVLISRARLAMYVFSNFKSNDIDLERTNSRGVVALKNFLAYAETGIIDQPYITGKEPDSPFEESVLRQLKLHGIDAVPQVGTSGFFIDIGITHPINKSEYILGVECDGASYHSTRSARDRDRLRQEVLESLGWNIYRIWSTDWFKNPETEFKKLLYAIENVKSLNVVKTDIPKIKNKKNLFREKNSKQDESNKNIRELVYKKASIVANLGRYEIFEIDKTRISDWIKKIVDIESPIHKYILTQRILESTGYMKSGTRINSAISVGVRIAKSKEYVLIKNDFLWKFDKNEVSPRDRSALPNSERKMEYIAPEEIQAALIQQVTNSFSIEDVEAGVLVANMLGFSRVTDRMLTSIKKEIASLLRKKVLKRNDGLLSINH